MSVEKKPFLYIATHRHWPRVTILDVQFERDDWELSLEVIKKHPDWKEGRYEKRGPSEYKGSVCTFWDTAFDLEYPVFEIVKAV